MGDQRIIGDRYRLSSRLGRGGTAEVYFGLDTRLCRPVAVKVLRPELAAEPEARALFRREARFVGGLQHPHVVAVYDAGETPDPGTGASLPYLVLEYVPGQTLQSTLAQVRALGPTRALRITRDLLDALGYCHAAGVVHHDVKPANVIVAPDGGVKLMDFGIARLLADGPTGGATVGAVRGTAKYLAPERLRGGAGDARADLYSVGVLLYQLVVGRPPFVGDEEAVLQQQLHAGPVAPSSLNPALGPDLDAILQRALAKAPADRYASAAEMRAAVQAVLDRGGLPALPGPVGPVAAAVRRRRVAALLGSPSRRRALVAAGVAAALVPMAGIVARTGDLGAEQVQASVSTVGGPATEAVEEAAAGARATVSGSGDGDGRRAVDRPASGSGSGSTGVERRDLRADAPAPLAAAAPGRGTAEVSAARTEAAGASTRTAAADPARAAAPAVDEPSGAGAVDRPAARPVTVPRAPVSAEPKPKPVEPTTRPRPTPPRAAPKPSMPPRGGGSEAPRPVVKPSKPAQPPKAVKPPKAEKPRPPKADKPRPPKPPRAHEQPKPPKPEKAKPAKPARPDQGKPPKAHKPEKDRAKPEKREKDEAKSPKPEKDRARTPDSEKGRAKAEKVERDRSGSDHGKRERKSEKD